MADAHVGTIGSSLTLAVKPGVSAKSVHAALDRIFELAGCTACGLNGILDLKINVINPRVSTQLDGIVGVSENLRF